MTGEPRHDHADDAVLLGIPELRFLSALVVGEKGLPVRTRRWSECRQRFAAVPHIERHVGLGDFDDAVER
jgi:hypothetical protein